MILIIPAIIFIAMFIIATNDYTDDTKRDISVFAGSFVLIISGIVIVISLFKIPPMEQATEIQTYTVYNYDLTDNSYNVSYLDKEETALQYCTATEAVCDSSINTPQVMITRYGKINTFYKICFPWTFHWEDKVQEAILFLPE